MSRPQSQRQHLIEKLESRELLAAGALDSSFSGDGKAFIDLANGEILTAADVAVQSDGKTIVAGNRKGATGKLDFAVARFNLDGSLDTSFGSAHSGLVTAAMGNANLANAEAVAIQADGKIVLVGTAKVNEKLGFNEKELAIARFLPNGTLDNTFDGDGKRTLDLGVGNSDTFGTDVAIQSDGKIVAVGRSSRFHLATIINYDFAIVRFKPNGALDGVNINQSNIAFDGDGKKFVDFDDKADDARTVAVDGSGKIYVGGNTDTDFGHIQKIGLVRLTVDGGGDSTFDKDAKTTFAVPVRTATSISGILVQGSKVVISGHTLGLDGRHNFIVARFNADGSIDPTFGTGGKGFTETDLGGDDFSGGITRAPTGTGFFVSGGSGGLAVVKYTQDGLRDSSFGIGGVARIAGFGGLARVAIGSLTNAGRRITLAGGQRFSTARILDTGANLVAVGALDPDMTEGTLDTGSLIVGRTERLTTPTRVFISIGGTATFKNLFGSDYQLSGMTVPEPITGTGGLVFVSSPFVDIPANQTFVIVRLAPIDDTAIEGKETAIFSIIPTASYEIGTPASAKIDIADNDIGVTTNLPGVTDSYVRDGTSAGTSFSSSTDLQVKTGGAGTNRISYIKFDLSTISSISSAKLVLFGKLSDTQNTSVVTSLFSVADNSWTGPTLTFNHKPAPGSTPLSSATVIGTTLLRYEFDVSNYVKQEKALGHNLVSFALKNPSSSASFVSFNSGNAGSNQPKLAVISPKTQVLIPISKVGTFTIASPHNSVSVGQATQIAVTWKVPSGGWRQLQSINLLLRDDQDKDLFAEIQWDETKNAFRLYNPSRLKFDKSKPVGSDGVLHNNLIDVLLKNSSVKASGPTSPMVTVTFAFRFNLAAAGHNFTIEASARNDTGSRSALSPGGVVKVKPIS